MVMAMVTAMVAERIFRTNTQRPILLGMVLGAVAFPVCAGEWKITPSIAVNETATDNVALSSSAQKKSDLITDISPGISIDGSGGRSRLHLNYQLHNLFYAQDSARNRTQNSLNASGTLEALENWLFIDASGVISQQSISAFGGATSTTVNTNVNNNTTETSSYRISPHIRGVLGNFADYQVRYNLSTASTKSNKAFDSDSTELTATLRGVTSLANLRWSLDASSQNVKFENGRSNEADRLRGVLTYQFDPQFRASLIAGREANDYLSLSKEGHTIKGAGLDWSPTERTQISASRESRFFGNSNSFSFSHRTAGSAWKISESKDAAVQSGQQAAAGLGTFYDLFFSLFASTEPDPIKRAALVDSLLLSSGLPGTSQVPGGFLSSGVTLQHRREMSFALLGVRNTVAFAASQSDSRSLSQSADLLPGEDFANVQNIRQRGASINWSHRLTALSSLTGIFSRMISKGTGSTTLETTQQMMNLNFSTQLGPKTNAGIGARRVVVDGSTNYTENALTGSLSHQF